MRERRRAGIGAQPQIGAEDVAVAGALLEQPDQPRAAARRIAAAVCGRRMRTPRRVVEHDQVDVARVVQLAAAELAHAQHDEAGPSRRRVAGRRARARRRRRAARSWSSIARADRGPAKAESAAVTRSSGHSPAMSASAMASAAPARAARSLAGSALASPASARPSSRRAKAASGPSRSRAGEGGIALQAVGQERAVAEDRVEGRRRLVGQRPRRRSDLRRQRRGEPALALAFGGAGVSRSRPARRREAGEQVGHRRAKLGGAAANRQAARPVRARCPAL